MNTSLTTLRKAALPVVGLVLALAVPVAGASQPTATTTPATARPGQTSSTSSGASTTPQTTSSEATPTTSTPTGSTPTSSTPTTSTPTSSTPATSTPTTTGPRAGARPPAAPQVRGRHSQSVTGGPSKPSPKHSRKSSKHGAGHARHAPPTPSSPAVRAGTPAPAPSTLTPSLPSALSGSIGGVSGFFAESFQIPPFLLPIYQAAGSAYDIPWQVLAAINEVETDYGRDLSVSSAGAEGWMQFLPTEWAQYGVDANGDGYKDPYSPADAIFAAARYLHAAGGSANISAAVYSYNHSQAYVSSVLLRAQLLGGTPPEMLDAITGLTEARFPVHAPAHFADGFATVGSDGPGGGRTLVGTTIYSQPGAPVIAVQDGEVVGMGESPSLGQFVSLRDAYGNVYTYAQLGSVAGLYPVLQPLEHAALSARIAQPASSPEAPPSGPATAGAQPRSPLSFGAIVSSLALGAAASLEAAPNAPAPAGAQAARPARVARTHASSTRVFRSGENDVFLHPLQVGVQVIAGTVLGHLGAASGASAGGQDTAASEAHMLFQIRPAGTGAPLIDPKPILDGWVALENSSTFRAKGENPFLATAPSAGQVLLESKGQLEHQVVRDSSINIRECERRDVPTGRVDRRVLATIELLSVSGLKPTVSGLPCGARSPATEGNPHADSDEVVKITAVNGVPIAGHQGPGSVADTTVRKLLTLQGANRPKQIVSSMSYPGVKVAATQASAASYIAVAFGPLGARGARAAGAFDSSLSAHDWTKLIARLGEIPDPTVSSTPSSAAIPDAPGAGAEEGEAGGDH
jgi:hypothetical protein